MIKTKFTIIALFLTLAAAAQKGKKFPLMHAVTLEEKTMNIPVPNGKQFVVAMVFSRSAEDELKKWLNPLWDTFMNKPAKKNQFDMSASHDVNFYFIPMIAGLKKVFNEFKESTDKGFWPYVIDTDKTDMKDIAKKLGVEDMKVPYIMVLDKDGTVIEVQSGKYSADKEEKIEEACGGD
jgi:hypothetical protein